MKTKEGAAVLDIKGMSEDGVFSGYGSIFGNKDSYGDVVMAGAFGPSLAEHRRKGTKPKMFWQHDPHRPIGSWTDFAEDGKGLWVEGRLNMEVQQAREAYALLKAGDIDGLSIGYVPTKVEPDEKAGVLRLKEVRLIEVSVVSHPANDRALVDSVKAAEIENLRQRLAAGDRLKRRELESLMKEYLGLSNSEAERASLALLPTDDQGAPEVEPKGDEFAAAFLRVMGS